MVNSATLDGNAAIGQGGRNTKVCSQISRCSSRQKPPSIQITTEEEIISDAQTQIDTSYDNSEETKPCEHTENPEDDTLCCSLPLDKVQSVLFHPSKCEEPKSARKLLCLYCERTFASANLRQKHVERIHSMKKNRRLSSRKYNLTTTPCIYCEKLNTSENTLKELFCHHVTEHSNKYFGCLLCEERFLTNALLSDHNALLHPFTEVPKIADKPTTENEESTKQNDVSVKLTRSRVKPKEEVDQTKKHLKSKNAKLKELRSKKLTVKSSRLALNRRESKRLQALAKLADAQKKKRQKPAERKQNILSKPEAVPEKSRSTCINPYPEFDNFYRVKKITDHSIDNLKISSLTFDDVFDKAFFNRIKCNIEENLLHHIDGKLFKNEESESRISNFEKVSNVQPEIQSSSSENYGCELSLNAVTPVAALSLNSQFGEDFESQIEYGSKPSKKKTQTKKDEVHYKYFTRRKFQASILEHKENRDLSKLDMWTQLVIKKRQQKIIDDKKTAKEIQEYTSGDEYRNKVRREELNRILDRRGPFEDLREEASKKAALDKLNSVSEDSISHESFTEVRDVLNKILNRVFQITEEVEEVVDKTITDIQTYPLLDVKSDLREIPSFLNLRRSSTLPNDSEIDQSDKISLICSSQDTENFELPTNATRGKNELIELSGEWARCRLYICAACGAKLPNMKYLLDHKTIYHQNVWVQHYEFVGNQSELYRHLSIPVLGKVGYIEDNVSGKMWKRSDARVCSKCKKRCNSLGELHRHILECGGDWTWILERKKCKYRYGAKSRRKKKGLTVNVNTKRRKTDSTEKKKYKYNGPRQRPSDAETIQRMLANLPAKRSTRKLTSLCDGVKRNKKKHNVQQKKVKCGKVIYDKSSNIKETTEKTINTAVMRKKSQKNGQSSNIRSLRSLSRVLSSRILDTNAKLTVKRKLKVLNDRRRTRQSMLTDEGKKGNDESESSQPSSISQQPRKMKGVRTDNPTSKRTSPRSTKLVRKMKLLSGNINIKSFFPVKKRKDNINTKEDLSLETKDIQTRSKKKSTELEDELKAEEKFDSNQTKSDRLSNLVRSLNINKKKNIKKPSQDKTLVDVAQETENPNKKLSKEDLELNRHKRKLKQSFRNVINRVKRLKIDATSDAVQNTNTDKLNSVKSPFLDENKQEKDLPVKIVIPSNIEAKENIADISETAHTVIPFNESNENSPVPESIFKLDSNNEKNLQAKGEPNFDTQETMKTDSNNEELLPKIDNNNTEKLEPISVETSLKTKTIPMISPNMKGKIKKPARGLNDCIAMLTSKLQQKTSHTMVKATNLNILPSTTPPKIVTDPSPQKAECILKIPTFKTLNDPLEEVALDLSTKPKNRYTDLPIVPLNKTKSIFDKESPWDFTRLTSVERIIENVVNNKYQEPQTLPSNPLNSVDQTIQNVIDGHVNNKSKLKTSVDDIIDYVINFGKNTEKQALEKVKTRKVGSVRKIKDSTNPAIETAGIIELEAQNITTDEYVLKTSNEELMEIPKIIVTENKPVDSNQVIVTKEKIKETRKLIKDHKYAEKKLLIETQIDNIVDTKELSEEIQRIENINAENIEIANEDEPNILENKSIFHDITLPSPVKPIELNMSLNDSENKNNSKQNLRNFRKEKHRSKSASSGEEIMKDEMVEIFNNNETDDIESLPSINDKCLPMLMDKTDNISTVEIKLPVENIVKRKRGRPRKIQLKEQDTGTLVDEAVHKEIVNTENIQINPKDTSNNIIISFKTKKRRKGKLKFTMRRKRKVERYLPLADKLDVLATKDDDITKSEKLFEENINVTSTLDIAPEYNKEAVTTKEDLSVDNKIISSTDVDIPTVHNLNENNNSTPKIKVKVSGLILKPAVLTIDHILKKTDEKPLITVDNNLPLTKNIIKNSLTVNKKIKHSKRKNKRKIKKSTIVKDELFKFLPLSCGIEADILENKSIDTSPILTTNDTNTQPIKNHKETVPEDKIEGSIQESSDTSTNQIHENLLSKDTDGTLYIHDCISQLQDHTSKNTKKQKRKVKKLRKKNLEKINNLDCELSADTSGTTDFIPLSIDTMRKLPKRTKSDDKINKISENLSEELEDITPSENTKIEHKSKSTENLTQINERVSRTRLKRSTSCLTSEEICKKLSENNMSETSFLDNITLEIRAERTLKSSLEVSTNEEVLETIKDTQLTQRLETGVLEKNKDIQIKPRRKRKSIKKIETQALPVIEDKFTNKSLTRPKRSMKSLIVKNLMHKNSQIKDTFDKPTENQEEEQSEGSDVSNSNIKELLDDKDSSTEPKTLHKELTADTYLQFNISVDNSKIRPKRSISKEVDKITNSESQYVKSLNEPTENISEINVLTTEKLKPTNEETVENSHIKEFSIKQSPEEEKVNSDTQYLPITEQSKIITKSLKTEDVSKKLGYEEFTQIKTSKKDSDLNETKVRSKKGKRSVDTEIAAESTTRPKSTPPEDFSNTLAENNDETNTRPRRSTRSLENFNNEDEPHNKFPIKIKSPKKLVTKLNEKSFINADKESFIAKNNIETKLKTRPKRTKSPKKQLPQEVVNQIYCEKSSSSENLFLKDTIKIKIKPNETFADDNTDIFTNLIPPLESETEDKVIKSDSEKYSLTEIQSNSREKDPFNNEKKSNNHFTEEEKEDSCVEEEMVYKRPERSCKNKSSTEQISQKNMTKINKALNNKITSSNESLAKVSDLDIEVNKKYDYSNSPERKSKRSYKRRSAALKNSSDNLSINDSSSESDYSIIQNSIKEFKKSKFGSQESLLVTDGEFLSHKIIRPLRRTKSLKNLLSKQKPSEGEILHSALSEDDLSRKDGFTTSTESLSFTETPDVMLLEEKIRNAIRRSLIDSIPNLSLQNNSLGCDAERIKHSEVVTSSSDSQDMLVIQNSKLSPDLSPMLIESSTSGNLSFNYDQVETKEINKDEIQNTESIKLLNNIDIPTNLDNSVISVINIDDNNKNNNPEYIENTKENTYVLKENLSKNTILEASNNKRSKLKAKKGRKRLIRNQKSDTDLIPSPPDTVNAETHTAVLVCKEIETKKEPPIKLIINKQKTRRKSKNIKKAGLKGHNDLFEDFSLVIKKKRKAPIITFSPPDTFSKEDTYSFNEHTDDDTKHDSVEEMDMELDDIPITTNIIETSNLNLANIASEGISIGKEKTSKAINKKKRGRSKKRKSVVPNTLTPLENLAVTEKTNEDIPPLKINLNNDNNTFADGNLNISVSNDFNHDFSSDGLDVDNTFEDSIIFDDNIPKKPPTEDADALFDKLIESSSIIQPKTKKKGGFKILSISNILSDKKDDETTTGDGKPESDLEENHTNKLEINNSDNFTLSTQPLTPVEVEQITPKNIDKFIKPVSEKTKKKSTKKRSKSKNHSDTFSEESLTQIIEDVSDKLTKSNTTALEGDTISYLKEQIPTHKPEDFRKEDIDKLYAFSETEDFELEKPLELPKRLPRKSDNLDKILLNQEKSPKKESIIVSKNLNKKKVKTVCIEPAEQTKRKSKEVLKEDLLDKIVEISEGRKNMRTAKVKALENIHDEAVAELTDTESVLNKKSSIESSSKRLNKKQKKTLDNIELLSNEVEVKEKSVSALNTNTKKNTTNKKKNDKFLKPNEAFVDFPPEVLGEAPLIEDLVAELDGLQELENSIERELNAEINLEQASSIEKETNEETVSQTAPTEHKLGTEENQELRRSRRGSRKIASYNENDLIDPIIDALENKRKSKKKEETIESKQQKKLNSEQLFDMLKANNETNHVPKQNSFLNNLDDSREITDENFDNVFENMLEKSAFLSQKKQELEKIYEFKDSSENTNSLNSIEVKSRYIKKNKKLDDNESASLSLDSYSESRATSDQFESNYCEICNKSFVKIENLIKHRRTLTHIQKLSEIEAKQAEQSKIISRHDEETSRESIVETSENTDFEQPNLIIGDILTNKDNIQSTFNTNHSLKLADIISDVLNKPVLAGIDNEPDKFADIILSNDNKRYKSLGERKSFDSDRILTTEAPFETKTTNILEKQISLLENIIENQTTNNYIDDISASSEKSDTPSEPRSPIMSKPIQDNSFIKPTQYEEISEDSANLRNYEDQKLRKTLNRDEELFLECCSLLKSSSEVSSSYSNKKLDQRLLGGLGLKPIDEPEWLQKKTLPEKKYSGAVDDYSDNSRIPTPLGSSYEDDASNSNTISSNWGMDKSQEGHREDLDGFEARYNFENITDETRKGTEVKSEGLLMHKRADFRAYESTTSHRSSIDYFSDGSLTDKRIITKGARKVFEGLKVSIPTEELNLEEVLNSSPKLKRTELVIDSSPDAEKLSPSSTKSRNNRKSKPVKKAQIGGNILFKVNKKKIPSPSISKEPDDKDYDVYDFEETQDNTDVFTQTDFKAFRTLKTGENDSDTESKEYAGSFVTLDPIVQSSLVKKPKAQENITKNKCMIMGRIFKNAAKSKIEDIDEEIQNLPELDNEELIENYVADCKKVFKNETKPKHTITEEELQTFLEEKLDQCNEPTATFKQPKSETKKLEFNKKKQFKIKGKKRIRTNSDSTDDEFSLSKTVKRKTNRKNAKKEDNCINLEQELKECIGVASRKSQRKCTSGKQNVLVEYWSSDDSQFEALLEKQIIEIKPKAIPIEKPLEDEEQEQITEILPTLIEQPVEPKKTIPKKKSVGKKKKSQEQATEGSNNNRRKRAAANPLYHWSSSSEDESNDLIEVKPLRDEIEDDEDRPVQHGWIVGDSPKKLVTMLAQAKGKKPSDIDSVKEQGKKRTNTVS